VVFIEARKGRLVTSGNSEKTVGKNSLGIAEVTKDLFNAPLARSVPKVSLGICQVCAALAKLIDLCIQRDQDIMQPGSTMDITGLP